MVWFLFVIYSSLPDLPHTQHTIAQLRSRRRRADARVTREKSTHLRAPERTCTARTFTAVSGTDATVSTEAEPTRATVSTLRFWYSTVTDGTCRPACGYRTIHTRTRERFTLSKGGGHPYGCQGRQLIEGGAQFRGICDVKGEMKRGEKRRGSAHASHTVRDSQPATSVTRASQHTHTPYVSICFYTPPNLAHFCPQLIPRACAGHTIRA